jgi:microcystin-dependent protein
MTALKNGPGMIPHSGFPENPIDGETVFQTDAASFRYYDGSRWQGIPPVGIVEPFAGSAAPAGWLLCDGSAVSRTTYRMLFDVIETIYGAGNGTTTFALPDLRGRAVHGVDGMGSAASSGRMEGAPSGLGAAGGSQYLQIHTHTFAYSGNTGNDSPDHGHQWTLASAGNAQGTGDLPFRGYNIWDYNFRSGQTAWSGYGGGLGVRHTHTFSYSVTTGPGPASADFSNNVPPTRVFNFIIKH